MKHINRVINKKYAIPTIKTYTYVINTRTVNDAVHINIIKTIMNTKRTKSFLVFGSYSNGGAPLSKVLPPVNR